MVAPTINIATKQKLGNTEKSVVRTNLIPIGKLVAFEIIDPPDGLSDLILPENAAEPNWTTPTCWVIAVGPDCKQCKVGDKVTILATQPIHLIKEGRGIRNQFYLINEEHIQGVYPREG